MKILIPIEVAEFLRASGTYINIDGGYYNIPMWYKDLGDGVFEVLEKDELPKEVLQLIENKKPEENE